MSNANLSSRLHHLPTRKRCRQHSRLVKIPPGTNDLISHWLRELSVRNIVDAGSGGAAEDVLEETAGERRGEGEDRVPVPALFHTEFNLFTIVF